MQFMSPHSYRLQNSGKLTLEDSAAFDLCGFQKVYFFSRPECVTVLKAE